MNVCLHLNPTSPCPACRMSVKRFTSWKVEFTSTWSVSQRVSIEGSFLCLMSATPFPPTTTSSQVSVFASYLCISYLWVKRPVKILMSLVLYSDCRYCGCPWDHYELCSTQFCCQLVLSCPSCRRDGHTACCPTCQTKGQAQSESSTAAPRHKEECECTDGRPRIPQDV